MRQWTDRLSRCFGKHSQIIPCGRQRETRRESGLRSFFVKRISCAVRWLRALLSWLGPLRRTFILSFRRRAPRFQIRTDASPYGFGRVIIRHHCRPEACWADSLSDDELSRFRAVTGDVAWQAEWELLAILNSLHVFRSKLVESMAQVVVQSDSPALCLSL